MTPIALMRALIRFGLAVQKTYAPRPLTGRRAARYLASARNHWITKNRLTEDGGQDNRKARRTRGERGDHKEVIAAMKNMGEPA